MFDVPTVDVPTVEGTAVKLATTTLIDAPPEAVFDLLADPAKQMLWRDGLVEHRPSSPSVEAGEVGSAVDEVFRKGRAKTEFVVHSELITSDRPSLYATRISHESFAGDVTYHLDVVDGKTRLVAEADMTYQGNVVSRFLSQMAVHHNRKDMKALVALAEAR